MKDSLRFFALKSFNELEEDSNTFCSWQPALF
jgi:hypothetical protein